jgi:hypothetical protein
MRAPSAKYLRYAIIRSLRKQGYSVKRGLIQIPENPSKHDYRDMNKMAIRRNIDISGPGIQRYEDKLIKYIANGEDVEPERISPKIVIVKPESEQARLFRYVCLHWSIPVSSGYGRRIRFLVFDESNDKLIGLFGLGDPVYAMKKREDWIGWDREAKAERLYHIMDAYVLGAVPPYSYLLGGKLVAMLACSNEVRKEFHKKYEGRESLIRKKIRSPYLVLITTSSALGRSSVYNRIRVNGQEYWTSVGFTQGSGEFHFSNGVYDKIRAYVERYCEPTAKQEEWGEGFRNKREVIRKCLSKIGLSSDLIYHGIKREIFAAPLARKALQFLRGEVKRPCFYDWSVSDLSKIFADRWLFSRVERKPEYRKFEREQYRIWQSNKGRS